MIFAFLIGTAMFLKLFFWHGLAGDLVFAMWCLTFFVILALQKAKSPFSPFISLWLVAAGLSMFTTKMPLTTLTSWFIIDVYALVFCLIRKQLKTPDTCIMLWGLLSLGALASALVGIKEFIWMRSYDPAFITDQTQKLLFEVGRASSLQGWPTAFAGLLILFIPSMILLVKKEPTPARIVYLTLLLAGLFASQSILPVVCLVVALILNIKIEDIKWGLLSLLVIFFYVFGTKTFDVFVTTRLEYLKTAYDMILQHPFFGGGFGAFLSPGVSKSAYAHNSYLQVWAETGLMGFIALVGIARAFVLMRPHNRSTLEMGLYIGLLAVFLDNWVSFTILKPNLSLVWWVCLALYNNIHEEERTNTCAS